MGIRNHIWTIGIIIEIFPTSTGMSLFAQIMIYNWNTRSTFSSFENQSINQSKSIQSCIICTKCVRGFRWCRLSAASSSRKKISWIGKRKWGNIMPTPSSFCPIAFCPNRSSARGTHSRVILIIIYGWNMVYFDKQTQSYLMLTNKNVVIRRNSILIFFFRMQQ